MRVFVHYAVRAVLSLLWALGVAAIAARLTGTAPFRRAQWSVVLMPLFFADALGIVCNLMLTCKTMSLNVDHGPSMRKAARAWLWNTYFGLGAYSVTVGGLGGLAAKFVLSNSLDSVSSRAIPSWGVVAPLLVQGFAAAALWLTVACMATPPRRFVCVCTCVCV